MKKLLFFTIFLFSIFARAQDYEVGLDYYLPKDITYNESIPTPKSVIGHEIGQWHVTHDKLVQYMYELAAASDRIQIENRGFTFEGRPLLLLTISSPSNLTNIEAIKADHMALTEVNASTLNTQSMPIVVYQGFSIHGNEASGANAGMAVAYYLAAAENQKIDELLKNTIILLDPTLNPDGLQRFAYWANIHKSDIINPDPNDREYHEVWPGGRTNHYWFDLNRDWLPAQLPESQARIRTFHEWYPNILTDHHEMGTNASFFFQPGIPSRTHPLTPSKNQKITGDIAKFHAHAFDKIGSLYYTEESFDDFYYGKGSTFPDINGGIGILFEQASSRGHAQESDNGILTFPFAIRNQFTAALSTLNAALSMRNEILNYQREFYSNARKEAHGKEAIVFGDEKDPSKVYHLAEILERHSIKFYELKNDFIHNGMHFKKGYSYVVPKNQKQHRLINAIFEKRTKFQDSLFYDVSAWTFPLAFNLDYTEEAKTNLIGPEVTKLIKRPSPKPQMSNYAYLMEWHDYYAPKALYMILQKGLRAKVGMKKFSIDGREYDYGTILIPAQNQKLTAAEISKVIHEINDITHVSFSNVESGLTSGIDLGSNQFRNVELPKVAMIIGDGINSYDAGEIWHLFDQRFKMLITKIDAEDFTKMDLGRYTDIIIPNSRGNSLDKKDSEKLKSWVEKGGTLIGYKNVGKWLDNQKLLKMKFKSKKDTATAISFEQVRNFRGAQAIGGAIFKTKLDRSHPIAFGYKNSTLPVFRNSTLFLTPDANSYKNPIQYTSTPLLSGYISNSNLEALQNTSAFKTGRIGRGRVIYFTDNHNFRAFWYGTNKLLMNAIFFGDEM